MTMGRTGITAPSEILLTLKYACEDCLEVDSYSDLISMLFLPENLILLFPHADEDFDMQAESK